MNRPIRPGSGRASYREGMKLLVLAIVGALVAGALAWAFDLHSTTHLHDWLASLHGR